MIDQPAERLNSKFPPTTARAEQIRGGGGGGAAAAAAAAKLANYEVSETTSCFEAE